MTILGAVLGITAVLLFLPVAILLVEVLSALASNAGNGLMDRQRPPGLRVAVLIPAHDEEDGIGATVSGIARQLGPSDRLIVVVDNCRDATRERAVASGAETIERHDLQHRGKGYALDFGVRHLDADPPDIVVIVDADCRLGLGTINRLVACSHMGQRAAQSFYAMDLSQDADAKRRVAGFAWIVKNQVRPSGLLVLGFPCQLMGTGMAIPWDAIRRIDLATGNIVEDVKMGLDLAAVGYAPIYCPEAGVKSDFPTTERGFAVQRVRWEAGSLRTVMKIAPVMFLRGLVSLNVPLMAMAADLMVPPLMMLLATLVLGLALSCILGIAGGSIFPAAMFGVLLLILMLTLVLAWIRFGREVLQPHDMMALPGVFVRKFGLYFAMWRGRGAGWIRTDRK